MLVPAPSPLLVRLFSPRSLALIVATVALWLASVELPGPPDLGLHLSWQGALIDSHLKGRQFGPDIAFTYGPWAFLGFSGYAPAALDAKLLWEIFGRLAFAATAVALSLQLSSLRRWLFLATVIAIACFFETSVHALLTVLTLAWLVPREATPWERALAVGWLAFFAHFKFVFFVAAVVAISLVVALRCAERHWRSALGLVTGFTAAYLAAWLAAGQSLANLPTFWRQSAEISDGYSWAMGIDPATDALLAGLAVVVLCGSFLFRLARTDQPWPRRLATGLILTASWLLAWKQGYTRADAHVIGFFAYCLVVGIALPGLFGGRGGSWLDAANPAVCLFGIATISVPLLWEAPRSAWARWQSHPPDLVNLGRWRQQFDANLRAAQVAARDDLLQSIVGRETIDVFNYTQGLALLNGLNYHPRPGIQSYNAYKSAIARANLRFYQSPRAPKFALVQLDTVDGRYPAQEDALVLAELVRHYHIARLTPNYLLLRRGPQPPAATQPKRTLLAQHVPHFGDEIPVPNGAGHPVWVEIDSRPTLIGRLRAFLYHAASARLAITRADGTVVGFRLVPGTASDGFFLNPLIEDHRQLAALVRGRGTAGPRLLRFDFEHPQDHWFWRRPRVRFYALPDLPLVVAEKWSELVDGGAVNVRPLSANAAANINVTSDGGHALLFAHAPSEIILPVPPQSTQLSGGHGLLEGSYRGGTTDGADFHIEALQSDGTAQTLLRRRLEPLTQSADQGLQPFRVKLPAGTNRLRLTIGAGSRSDPAWDWTYWGDLELLP